MLLSKFISEFKDENILSKYSIINEILLINSEFSMCKVKWIGNWWHIKGWRAEHWAILTSWPSWHFQSKKNDWIWRFLTLLDSFQFSDPALAQIIKYFKTQILLSDNLTRKFYHLRFYCTKKSVQYLIKILTTSFGYFLTWVWWVEHFGIISRRCLAIRSRSWLTRKDGGRAETPARGIVISSRHMGQRNCPVSRANVATIRSKQCRHTVWEQGSNLGLFSPPSYMPAMQNFV